MPADRFSLMLMTTLGTIAVPAWSDESAATTTATAPAPKASGGTGRLRVEGRFVTRLLLARPSRAFQEVIVDQEGMATLPAGSYVLRGVQIEDPSSAAIWWGWMSQEQTFAITPGGLTTVKAGGPLQQRVSAQRDGRVIVLSHELIGIGGERYRGDNSRAPRFAVYDGKRRIGSGQFEYG